MFIYREGGRKVGKESELDPRVCYEPEESQPMEDVKIIMLREGKGIRIGCNLKPELEEGIVRCL